MREELTPYDENEMKSVLAHLVCLKRVHDSVEKSLADKAGFAALQSKDRGDVYERRDWYAHNKQAAWNRAFKLVDRLGLIKIKENTHPGESK